MTRLLVTGVVLVAAVGVAGALRRRRPDPPFRDAASVPRALDRRDFDRPEAPWLVVVFSSSACASCRDAAQRCAPLASDSVAVQEVEWSTAPDLHRRYSIEAVPIVVVADADGTVRASFRGVPPTGELWGALAALRAGEAPSGRG